MTYAFPWLLQPLFWSARNRARRPEPGDGLRAALFGRIGLVVAGAIFAIAFWLTWQLLDYEELGDYLIRLGLGWLFLTFLSFVTFSAVEAGKGGAGSEADRTQRFIDASRASAGLVMSRRDAGAGSARSRYVGSSF